MDKNRRIKLGAILGGIWGLISGILYAWGAFASGFSGHGNIGALFNNMPSTGKLMYLPAFLTDAFSGRVLYQLKHL